MSEVITRLAMEGIEHPDDAVLLLLCRGDLEAEGDYRWQKYESGRHYQLEETVKPIRAIRWQALSNSISKFESSDDFRPEQFAMTELQLGTCDAFEWEPLNDRFSLASRTVSLQVPGLVTLEEWYSVGGIRLRPRFADFNEDEEPYGEIATTITSEPTANIGGRPPAADWEAAALQLAGKYYRGDFKPKTKADVQRELASLLAESDIHPAPSTLAPHAKLIFEAFAAWERE